MTQLWNGGIKSIYKKQKLYKYFYLSNPPKDNEKQFKAYNDVQSAIREEAEEMQNFVSNSIDNDSIKRSDKIIEEMEKRAKDSLNNEEILYKKIVKNEKDKEKYLNMSDEEKIKFWTSYSYRVTDNSQKKLTELNDMQAFKLIIGSVQFYEAVKSKQSEIFSRHKLLQGNSGKLGKYITGKNNLTGKNDLFKDILTELKNSINSQTGSNSIYPMIDNTINTYLIEAIDDFIKGSKTDKKDLKITAIRKVHEYKSRKSNSNIEYQASTFSTNLRNDIRRIIEEEIKKQNISSDYIYTYKLKNSKNNTFLQVTLDENRQNIFSLEQKNFQYSAQDIKNMIDSNNISEQGKAINILIEKTIKSFNKALLSLNPSELEFPYTLDFKGIGKKTIQDVKIFNEIKEKAKNFINKGELRNFLMLQERQAVLRSFKASPSNQYITGLMGEIIAALNAKEMFKEGQIYMTGGTYNKIAGSTFSGQSVNDIVAEYSDIKFGINVKHYISQNNSVTLYGEGDTINLKSDYIKKYFSQDEVEIMKWSLANISFLTSRFNFNQNFPKQLGYIYSWNNIPTFMRIEQQNDDISNLFFQINNVIYPTSYIYKKIIEYIRDNNNTLFKMIGNDGLFQIKQFKSTDGIKISHNTRQEAIEYIENNSEGSNNYDKYENLYSIYSNKKYGNLSFKFSGIKFENLVQLNLFK